MRTVTCLLTVMFLLGCMHSCWAVDYLSQVKPILREKCYSCHGVLKQEADLRLETTALMMDGGGGAVIVPGDSSASLLVERVVADESYRMPPADAGAALKPQEIALLRAWIDEGAKAPDEAVPLAPQEHWAFQPIRGEALPAHRPSNGDAGAGNPVDHWLGAKHAELGLQPNLLAERPIALRRLYLDLLGMPPTQQQLRDERPWETIVDELLQSPQHGERWARHWMDVWRYSDWYGLGDQLRYSQKHLWHWRDWIVESLNEDKGYDQMILEMLAGDEIAPTDPDVVRATGFLARNYYLFNRTTWLDSTIEHTGKAFLGLTLNCAKCHDHKYDPITQLDYYRFRAIFEPHQVRLDPVPNVTDLDRDGLPRVFDDHLDARTYLHLRGDEKSPDEQTEITPSVPAILANFAPQPEPIELPAWAYAPGTRPYVQQDHLAAAQQAVAEAEQQRDLAAQKNAAFVASDGATEDSPQSSFTEIDESFAEPNPQRWEIIGDSWQYRDGALCQTTATREGHFVRLRSSPPRDFDLTCRYTVTGGATYKSVTLRFDESDDNQYCNFVYTSAHAPGPKVQVAYTRDGKQVYPPQGRKARKLEVGKTYQLRFAVRDRLVNVWLDDEFAVAYQLPDRRPQGRLSLSGFDSQVAFDHLTLRALAAETQLSSPDGSPTTTVSSTRTAVEIAAAKLAAARAKVEMIRAIIAADNLRQDSAADSQATDQAIKLAARREAEFLNADGQYERLLHAADPKKLKVADEKLERAAKLLKQIESGEAQYTPINASRKALETPEHNFTTYGATYPKQSTGRRLALARWMIDRNNPLTARVAVNHVWLRHFGEPLVESVFDFGLQAKRPEHLELLDYLATELVESGWSFKHLHRLLVNSRSYQLRCSTQDADPHTMATDPTNRYYWRMNTRRMESQAVRDTLLHLAGTLDTTLGGPSIKVATASSRRSLYFQHSGDAQDKFLTMFDDADLLQCYRRSESIVPQQALALSNSALALTASEQIAVRISQSDPDSTFEEFVDQAFFALLARLPSEEEKRECLEFGQQLLSLSSDRSSDQQDARIRVRLVHALINHNDFISIR